MVTVLRVTLAQVKVTEPPSKVIAPLLLLRVGELEIVKAPATVMVPLGAVKVPPEMDRAPFKSAPLGSDRLPELTVTVPLELKVERPLILKVPPDTVMAAVASPVKPDRVGVP